MKIVGGEDLPLDDGKVDFNLVKPTGMNRAVDEDKPRILLLETLNGGQATMRGAVIDNPEDAASIIIRRPSHNLIHEAIKRSDASASLASTKDFGAVNIESGQVGPSSASFVFVFDFHCRSRLRRQGRVNPATCLNACFFVGGNHKFVVKKRPSAPNPFVQVQEATCFCGKIRIARKDPCAVLPGPDCVGMQPSPNGAIADRGYKSRLADLGSQLAHTPARQRNVVRGRQFTGKRLNLNDQFWGEKPGVARGDRVLQAPRGALRRTVFATCSPLHGAYRDAKQFRRLTVLRPPLGSSSRAVPENTVTYIVLLVDVTPALPTSTR